MGLDTVEFVIDIEKEYSISISNQDAEKLGIVGDIARYIVSESMTQNGQKITFESALITVINLLVNTYGVSRQNISSISHVVDDLGLD
jgi:acyl carrier protein